MAENISLKFIVFRVTNINFNFSPIIHELNNLRTVIYSSCLAK